MKQQTKNNQNLKYNKKGHEKFLKMPVWRLALRMIVPNLILMSIMGIYGFCDNLLAINFAADAYQGGTKDAVRIYMTAFSSVNALIMAFNMLLGTGTSTRVSIHLGAGNIDKAKSTLATGIKTGFILSAILMPVLLSISKIWMRSLFDPSIATNVSNVGFEYGWIIIMLMPLWFWNGIIAATLRSENRILQMVVPSIISILLNLLFDWVFMGPVGLGIEGGAWSSALSVMFTTIVYVGIILKNKDSIIKFKDMFRYKMKWVYLLGIVMIGLTPFIRNLSTSITQTTELNIIRHVSEKIYFSKYSNIINALDANSPQFQAFLKKVAGIIKDPSIMKMSVAAQKVLMIKTLSSIEMVVIITGIFPILSLVFPSVISFHQATRPIAAFNYGAKQIKRVKESYWYCVLYTFVFSALLYFIFTFGAGTKLLQVLGVNKITLASTLQALKIMLSSILVISFVSSPIMLFSSTDRVFLTFFIALLRGIIMFFPVIFLFKYLAMKYNHYEFLFWYFYPTMLLISSIVAFSLSFGTLANLCKKTLTFEERFDKIIKKLKTKNKNLN